MAQLQRASPSLVPPRIGFAIIASLAGVYAPLSSSRRSRPRPKPNYPTATIAAHSRPALPGISLPITLIVAARYELQNRHERVARWRLGTDGPEPIWVSIV